MCVVTLLRVDWEAEAKLAVAKQRTIESLEVAMDFGASPEEVLDEEALYMAHETGAAQDVP